jgi:hypothetical protein
MKNELSVTNETVSCAIKEALKNPDELKKYYNNPHRSTSFKRKPRIEIDKNVSQTCDMLHSMGNRVTVRLVRKIIGKGSHSTISKYIKLWRERKNDKAAIETLQEMISIEKERQKIAKEFEDDRPNKWENCLGTKINTEEKESFQFKDGVFQ